MSKIFSRNPNELVDRYLQAVRFWLPKSHRQEDLIVELGEDLRSQIDEKAAELGHPVEEAEMSAILRRCGSPMMVAGRLGPQRHLIGPTLFPIYEFVLKMVLLWILIPVFIFIVGPVNVANAGSWGIGVAVTLANLWGGLFIAAGIVTLVFAIIERTSAQIGAEGKWDPLKLPPVRPSGERKPSPLKAVCELGFGCFGLVWLLLVPHYPFMIFGPAASFLKAAPLSHTVYVPILLLSTLGLVRSAVTLARPQWTWFPPLTQLLHSALTLILLKYIIQGVTGTPGGYPFVVLKDAVRDSPHYIQIAAVVNVSIVLSAAGTWLGLSIATIVQTWEFLNYLRKRNSGLPRPASIGVQ